MLQNLFYNLSEVPRHDGLVITQGTFDGVHCGHQTVLKQVVATAKLQQKKSLLLTFHPHPRLVVNPNDQSLRTLQSIEEKAKAVFALGIDYVLVLPFTEEISRKSPADFVQDILVNGLGVSTMVVGYDHRFGHNRTGGFEELTQLGLSYGFKVLEIEANLIEEIAVSSSRIRRALIEGHISEANQLLGSTYLLTGMVEKGKQLGRQIGFPTANIAIDDPYKLIPAHGVYCGFAWIQDQPLPMICNIGPQPTVNGIDTKVEAHILGFNQDLYNQTITLGLVQFLRKIERFDSLEALKNQLIRDREQATELLSSQNTIAI
jgi:riboflavin kinase/FMN adenylyltransferase